MNSENQIAKTVQVISVIALMIGASGCATQSTGGSKLGHDQLNREIAYNQNTIQVCHQYGARLACETLDRNRVIEDLEYLRDSMQYGNGR